MTAHRPSARHAAALRPAVGGRGRHRRRRRRAAFRLADDRAEGRGVRAGVRRVHRRRARGGGRATAPPRCTPRWPRSASARAMKSSCRRSPSSPRPTASSIRAARRSLPMSMPTRCSSIRRTSERKITPRTKAIVAVDYAGQPCDYEALRAIAARHGLAAGRRCLPRARRRLTRPARRFAGGSQHLQLASGEADHHAARAA